MKYNHLILPTFAVLCTAAVAFGINALAFTEPSSAPPSNNAAAPLDTSATANTKSGGLILNNAGAAGSTGLIVQAGNVGIDTLYPSSTYALDVAGKIRSSTGITVTSGGITFPDGKTQTTAASSSGASINYGLCYYQSVTLSSSYTSCNDGYVLVGMNFAQSAVWWPIANFRCCKLN